MLRCILLNANKKQNRFELKKLWMKWKFTKIGVWNKVHELIQFACFVYKSVTTAKELVQVLANKSKCTSHDNKLFV